MNEGEEVASHNTSRNIRGEDLGSNQAAAVHISSVQAKQNHHISVCSSSIGKGSDQEKFEKLGATPRYQGQSKGADC